MKPKNEPPHKSETCLHCAFMRAVMVKYPDYRSGEYDEKAFNDVVQVVLHLAASLVSTMDEQSQATFMVELFTRATQETREDEGEEHNATMH
jgi:hypothetical protein